MAEWFEAISLLEKVFLFIALPSTLILLIQTIMLFFGGVDDGSMFSDTSGFESSMDVSNISDALSSDFDDVSGSVTGGDLSFITIRGIIAFLTVSGWTGIICVEMGASAAVSVFVSVLLGLGALIGVAYLIRALLSLQSISHVNYKAALGQMGTVYLPISAGVGGKGKVSLTLDGTFKQYDAITNQDQSIKTGELVRVIDVVRGNVMVVEAETLKER